MIKKIIIEDEDTKRLYLWEDARYDNVTDKLLELQQDKENEYVIGFDIASENSIDKSVMLKLRLVDGKYVYEGFETI
jgi:hypothetical protein